ncbi:hypothetical protein EV174_003237 [Coemansia sp. RSA 2320]|nr:hypothetical protein EV174_003237 [Coemansia sp. RSA 2320]
MAEDCAGLPCPLDTAAAGVEQEQQDDVNWSTLQDRLRTSIVSISSSHCFYFDHDCSHCSNATGFVVDATLGIVLSNRHVMGSGPSFHKATFFNNQEVFLQPTYADPIHDFAFFRYDPAELNDSFVPKEIRLAPQKARSGLEFRIIGNNSNEKLSVHQGELSQLDRNAPEYGPNTYNDFNTFYYQASSTSKGGSSGSPVVDVVGDAVALNAGAGSYSSTSFFLPLERVVYALEFVRRWEVPPRGTLQVVFKHITHVQAERLGLGAERAACEGVLVDSTTGVLIIDKILPGGPADGKLQVGDIILSAESKPIPGFPDLFGIIDASVGRQIDIRVASHGEHKTVAVTVQDLYEITPSQFLVVGGAILHSLSLQKAFFSSSRIVGVAIAKDWCGFLRHSDVESRKVIRAVNGVQTNDLYALMNALRGVRHDESIVVKVVDHRDPRDEAVFVTRLPLVCKPDKLYTRSSVTGFWSHEPYTGIIKTAFPKQVIKPGAETLTAMSNGKCGHGADQAKSGPAALLAQDIERAVVSIASDTVCPADGQYCWSEAGCGFVVSKQHGIVLCSTRVVRNPTCNLVITFAGLASVPATLAYTHPLYPIAFLKYNPAHLDAVSGDVGADGWMAELELKAPASQEPRMAVGNRVMVLLGAAAGGLEVVPSSVSARSLLSTSTCQNCLDQRFFNTETFKLSPAPTTATSDLGVVCDFGGCIRGLWVQMPCCYHDQKKVEFVGLDSLLVLPVFESLCASEAPPDVVHVLDVEFRPQMLAAAKVLGASNDHIRDLSQTLPAQRYIFMVSKILRKRLPGVESLEIGDLVLRVDGRIVRHIDELACLRGGNVAELVIVRDQQEITVKVPTTSLAGKDTRRIIFWAGMYIQEPHLTALELASCPTLNVFVSINASGSPAERDVGENVFITEVAGRPIVTMDDMARIAGELKSADLSSFNSDVASGQRLASGKVPGRHVKLRYVTLAGETKVESLCTNDIYFPAWQLRRGPLTSDAWEWEEL